MIRSAWKSMRSRFWAALAFDVALIAAVMFGVHAWQTRELPLNEPMPETLLPSLADGAPTTAARPGETGVVYFFAPWCFYCRSSIDNLDELVAAGRVDWGTAVALSYEDEAEVRDFVERTGVTLPVLLGTARTTADWSVSAFPTYYVIDAEGRIASRSVGYSTWLGMRFRTWLAD